MLFIPVAFRSLFHHVIPGVNIVILVVSEQVIRRSGKLKNFLPSLYGLDFLKFFLYVETELSLCAFMSLVIDNEVPVNGENFPVFLVFSAADP